jgi:opacity protein-like surface antigen
MNTRTINTAVVSALLLTSLSLAHADDAKGSNNFTGNISGYIGQKSLDDNDWDKLDRQGSLGVIFDFKKQSWPVSIALDVFASGDEDTDGGIKTDGGTLETDIGVRKIFELSGSSIRPYIGGGIAIIGATVENSSGGSITSKDDDTATGAWIGGGMYYAATESLNIGLDLRYSEAEVTLFDEDREAGGFRTGVTVGYHW